MACMMAMSLVSECANHLVGCERRKQARGGEQTSRQQFDRYERVPSRARIIHTTWKLSARQWRVCEKWALVNSKHATNCLCRYTQMCTLKENKIRWHSPNTRDMDAHLSVSAPHTLCTTCGHNTSANKSSPEVTEPVHPKNILRAGCEERAWRLWARDGENAATKKSGHRLYLLHL
jgi:hypothetical protein